MDLFSTSSRNYNQHMGVNNQQHPVTPSWQTSTSVAARRLTGKIGQCALMHMIRLHLTRGAMIEFEVRDERFPITEFSSRCFRRRVAGPLPFRFRLTKPGPSRWHLNWDNYMPRDLTSLEELLPVLERLTAPGQNSSVLFLNGTIVDTRDVVADASDLRECFLQCTRSWAIDEKCCDLRFTKPCCPLLKRPSAPCFDPHSVQATGFEHGQNVCDCMEPRLLGTRDPCRYGGGAGLYCQQYTGGEKQQPRDHGSPQTPLSNHLEQILLFGGELHIRVPSGVTIPVFMSGAVGNRSFVPDHLLLADDRGTYYRLTVSYAGLGHGVYKVEFIDQIYLMESDEFRHLLATWERHSHARHIDIKLTDGRVFHPARREPKKDSLCECGMERCTGCLEYPFYQVQWRYGAYCGRCGGGKDDCRCREVPCSEVPFLF